MLNGHGDDIYNFDIQSIKSNFSSNVYTGMDYLTLEQYLCKCISAIHSYPEPDAYTLKLLLADKSDIKKENIWITNGATEAIYLIAQAFAQYRSAIVCPTFSEYRDACIMNKHIIDYVFSLEDVPEQCNMVWICNPNNPTGKVKEKQAILDYIRSHPEQYIILDHSYEYFTVKEILKDNQAVQYKNVVILHSMTKKYAIPGIRLGYVVADRRTIDKISAFSMPWAVNTLAQQAGMFLLQNGFQDAFDINGYLNETKRFIGEINKIKGIEVLQTDTHFFLCRLDKKKASDLKKYLIDKHGILIRDASNFYGLNENFFRIATQTPIENDNLVNAFKEWIS